MTSPKQVIFKTGNSLALSIPSRIVRRLGLSVGQTAVCHSSWEANKITYEFPDAKQLPLMASRNNNQQNLS